MTKVHPYGKHAQQVYALLEQLADQGQREGIDGLFLMLGEDTDGAREKWRTVIELFAKIARASGKMSDLEITAALKMLQEGD
ncbi:MAG: hypothetical protein LCI00_17075 [Chloroflexi bacterium]|nr:hypothetical protein [Chloroflexota bacterium]